MLNCTTGVGLITGGISLQQPGFFNKYILRKGEMVEWTEGQTGRKEGKIGGRRQREKQKDERQREKEEYGEERNEEGHLESQKTSSNCNLGLWVLVLKPTIQKDQISNCWARVVAQW